jgi:hypothetical protein
MRRALTVIGVTTVMALAACSSGSGGTGTGGDTSNTTPVSNPAGGGNSITDPIDRARSVVGQQNTQLQQEEQQTGYEDPTAP